MEDKTVNRVEEIVIEGGKPPTQRVEPEGFEDRLVQAAGQIARESTEHIQAAQEVQDVQARRKAPTYLNERATVDHAIREATDALHKHGGNGFVLAVLNDTGNVGVSMAGDAATLTHAAHGVVSALGTVFNREQKPSTEAVGVDNFAAGVGLLTVHQGVLQAMADKKGNETRH